MIRSSHHCPTWHLVAGGFVIFEILVPVPTLSAQEPYLRCHPRQAKTEIPACMEALRC